MSRVIASSPRAGRTTPCRHPVSQTGQPLLDPSCARLRLLRALDSTYVLPLLTIGQAMVSGAGGRIGVQGAGEVRGLDHNTWLGVDVHLDLDLVTDRDTGGLPVCVAQAEQIAPPQDGHPALPLMPHATGG